MIERERADDCREEEKTGEPPTYHYLSEMLENLAGHNRHMTSGCEGVENYQAEHLKEECHLLIPTRRYWMR